MNIYTCRFIDDNDKVTRINQYGNSEEEINVFWKEWWPKHYSTCPSIGKYVNCGLFEENVKYDIEKEQHRCDDMLESLKA